jgi:hypothetical protein
MQLHKSKSLRNNRRLGLGNDRLPQDKNGQVQESKLSPFRLSPPLEVTRLPEGASGQPGLETGLTV